MPKPGFTKLNVTDATLYGPKGLLLCGFTGRMKSKLESLLGMLGLSAVPRTWAASDDTNRRVADLFARGEDAGVGQPAPMPKAVVAAGLSEKELHRLMSGCRKAGLKNLMWATLTPTSEKWTLGALLDELQAERKALSGRKKRRPVR